MRILTVRREGSGRRALAVALLATASIACHQPPAVRPQRATGAPARMKAAQIARYGHADAITLNEVDVPAAGPGQVFLEVHASSINPVDVHIREGKRQERYPLHLPVTLGYDVAGVVSTDALEALTRLVEAGVVTPHVDRAYPLDRVREAFEAKERGAGSVRGKIAIVVIP